MMDMFSKPIYIDIFVQMSVCLSSSFMATENKSTVSPRKITFCFKANKSSNNLNKDFFYRRINDKFYLNFNVIIDPEFSLNIDKIYLGLNLFLVFLEICKNIQN
jgi:hypothetical protein